MKVVINRCYGGFGLSREAFLKLREMKNIAALFEPDVGEKWNDGSGLRAEFADSFCSGIPRDDSDLVKVVQELGKAASSPLAQLQIVEIPDDVEWEIAEYNGIEWVAEVHRTWAE